MNKEETIKTIIQEVLDVDRIQIINSAHLIHDLGGSEAQLSEIINRIEQTFATVLGFESFDMTVEELLMVVFSEIQEDKQLQFQKPRALHFTFAHQYLPALAFRDGLLLFADLRFKKGHDYMQHTSALVDIDFETRPLNKGLDYFKSLWQNLDKESGSEGNMAKELDYEIVEKAGKLILLVRFPQPRAVKEAYYALFVWKLGVPEEEAASYFTLEQASGDRTVIGQWTKSGLHFSYDTYNKLLTPRQFLEEVLKKFLPREDKSIIDGEKDLTSNPQFLVDGLFAQEHIYLKICTAIAHKLELPEELLDQHTSVEHLNREDFTDILSEVYEKYGIDVQKHLFFIRQEVDRLVKEKEEQSLTCMSLLIRICKHFEYRIAGDYFNPKEMYLDYRSKIDLISQSPEFAMLYNFISQTYPSFITDNADQKKIEHKTLLYREILEIPDKHLTHNYPIDPRGLFICLTAVAMAHANYSLDEVRMGKYLEAAVSLNTKWGPFVRTGSLEKLALHASEKKVRFRKLRRAMDSRLTRSIYKMFHELTRK